jgi:Cof subfamily protein (haloacid dehalogenase superfamily)
MKPEEILIYSDMDGTMLNSPGNESGKAVPQINLDALVSFIAAGGAVSIATGRKYSDTIGFFPGIVFSAPLVVGNGSCIMDQATEKVLYRQPLDAEYKASALAYVSGRPGVWLGADNEFVTYLVEDDAAKGDSLNEAHYRHRISPQGYLENTITKVCYVLADAKDTEGLIRDVIRIPGSASVLTMKTDARYVEVVHANASKALSIQRAVQLAGLSGRKLVCIGDYYNDVEMLQSAEIAACPCNAPEDIRKICDIVTCSNDAGAFADLLERLLR